MKALTSTSNKTKTLSAPLPQRAQERLDREAAYEQTKEEVDKWSATMKHIKQAIIYPVHRIYFVTNSRL
jgi:U3 small nucleolar RNA-associated protein 14